MLKTIRELAYNVFPGCRGQATASRKLLAQSKKKTGDRSGSSRGMTKKKNAAGDKKEKRRRRQENETYDKKD